MKDGKKQMYMSAGCHEVLWARPAVIEPSSWARSSFMKSPGNDNTNAGVMDHGCPGPQPRVGGSEMVRGWTSQTDLCNLCDSVNSGQWPQNERLNFLVDLWMFKKAGKQRLIRWTLYDIYVSVWFSPHSHVSASAVSSWTDTDIYTWRSTGARVERDGTETICIQICLTPWGYKSKSRVRKRRS